MVVYKFYGEYKANLIGKTITFDVRLRKELERYGISEMFFVKKEEKGFRNIQAFAELPPGEKEISVKVEGGKFRIPKKEKRELIEYAELKPKEVIIIGMEAGYLEICNKNKLYEHIKPLLSNEGMEKAVEELEKD